MSQRYPPAGYAWCVGGGPLDGECVTVGDPIATVTANIEVGFIIQHIVLGHYELRAGAYRWEPKLG